MNSRKISRFFVYFFLTVGALIMLLPFFWMFSSAFKTTQEINRFPPQWLPSHLSLENAPLKWRPSGVTLSTPSSSWWSPYR